MHAGFSSTYFIVPKKGGGLRPILDLRTLNRALHKLPFRMLTQKHIITLIRHYDWFASIDLKDAHFYVSMLPRHRPFLRFAFEHTKSSHSVWPCIPASSQRSPRLLKLPFRKNYFISAHSKDGLCKHKHLVFQHLDYLGLRVNWEKSKLSSRQRILFSV